MKKKINVKIIVIVISILIISTIVVYLLLNESAVKSYGCEEILEQVDECWENRELTSTESFIECWEAPEGYINTCEEGELESRDYLDKYMKCNKLSIIYYPPHMLVGYDDKPEGMVSNNCPLM